MSAMLEAVSRGTGMHGVCAGAVLLLLAWVWWLRRRLRAEAMKGRRAAAILGEMQAYAQLDLLARPSEHRGVSAKRVCRTIAEKSGFQRAAVLLRDGDGRLAVAGSVGCDDLTVRCLERWGADLADGTPVEGEISAGMEAALGRRVGRGSYAVRLERRQVRRGGGVPDATEVGCRGMVVIPVWSDGAGLMGALAVCRGPAMDENAGPGAHGAGYGGELWREEEMVPLEALASRLGQTIENAGEAADGKDGHGGAERRDGSGCEGAARGARSERAARGPEMAGVDFAHEDPDDADAVLVGCRRGRVCAAVCAAVCRCGDWGRG